MHVVRAVGFALHLVIDNIDAHLQLCRRRLDADSVVTTTYSTAVDSPPHCYYTAHHNVLRTRDCLVWLEWR